jgi:hypothetical protein
MEPNMSLTKILLCLASTLCLLAATATPALALFEATTSGATTGKGTSAESVLSLGLLPIVSSKDSFVWRIQDSKANQTPTKIGPHEDLAITFEEVTVAGNPLPNVFCELQLVQPNKGETKATVLVSKVCIVKAEGLVPGCTITVTAGSGAKNTALTKNTLTKKTATIVNVTAEDEHITSVTTEACKALGLTPGENTEGKLTSTETQEDMSLV